MKFYVKKMVEMVAILKNGGHFEIYVVNGIFHKNDPRGTISQILVLLSRFERFFCLSAVLLVQHAKSEIHQLASKSLQ